LEITDKASSSEEDSWRTMLMPPRLKEILLAWRSQIKLLEITDKAIEVKMDVPPAAQGAR